MADNFVINVRSVASWEKTSILAINTTNCSVQPQNVLSDSYFPWLLFNVNRENVKNLGEKPGEKKKCENCLIWEIPNTIQGQSTDAKMVKLRLHIWDHIKLS